MFYSKHYRLINSKGLPWFWLYCLIGFGLKAFAQQEALGSWNILHLKYNYNASVSLFAEAQLRSLAMYQQFHYYEYKGGIQYKLHPNLRIALAAGSYQTYAEGGNFVTPKNNDEFRLWPQVLLVQPIGRFNIEQRYRAEGRFTSRGYRNRFRYRPSVSYPFGKKKNNQHPFLINLSNELFFTNRAPYFERNRLMLACIWRPLPALQAQVGYLHQFDYRINDETGRDFLVLGLYLEFWRKTSTERTPTQEMQDE